METKAQQIIEWLQAGMALSAVAMMAGISEARVIDIVNRATMPKPVTITEPAPSWQLKTLALQHPNAERDARIKERYEAGDRPYYLAGLYALDNSRIDQILKKQGAKKWLHIKNRDERGEKAKAQLQAMIVPNDDGHWQATKRPHARRRAKLNDEQRLDIGQRYAGGEDMKTIAADYGLHPHSVAWVANKLGCYRPGFGPGVTVITKLREYTQAEQQNKSN